MTCLSLSVILLSFFVDCVQVVFQRYQSGRLRFSVEWGLAINSNKHACLTAGNLSPLSSSDFLRKKPIDPPGHLCQTPGGSS